MEKRGALAALALVLFLFCTEEWAAEAQCMLPPQSSLEEMEKICQPDKNTGEILASCCRGLRSFDWDCLCSPASQLVISPTIRSALASCGITVPQTDRCLRSTSPPAPVALDSIALVPATAPAPPPAP